MKDERLLDILPLVSKPSRYLGSEVNSVTKDPSGVKLRFALCFPDTYEIGISHLGLKILYEALNRVESIYAERAYAPWPDLEEKLRGSGIPLSTVETGTPLSGMDIVGFTLQYELSYTNVLNMLSLSGIPLLTAGRGPDDPLVIAGGPCAFNPEPLALFMDAFVIGDAEEAAVEIAEAVLRNRESGGGRDALLKYISGISGVYVPSHFEVVRKPDGGIAAIKNTAGGPDRVKKRTLTNLDTAPYPDRPIVPYMAAVHNRVTLEVARGCLRGCRFCQAGYIYRPYRTRRPENVLGLAERSISSSGFDEMSLTSLSTGDYPNLLGLMRCLMDRYEDKRISVSLPSLRVGTLTPQMCEQIKRVRKTGFTVAPEAGTQRLRDVINKNITEDALIETAATVFGEGWELIKLYFMIGLPTETDEDLDGIIRLSRLVLDAGRRAGGRRKKVNVGVSTFAPKPHTPFQWMGQIPMDEIERRMSRLEAVLDRKPFAMKTGSAGMSVLEAAFSRGGRELGRAIEVAWRRGARFDGWSEHFDFGLWREAFAEAGLDVEAEASRSYGLDEILPWDHIDTGVTKAYFKKEYARALKAEQSPDCRTRCTGCGLKCRDEGTGEPMVEEELPSGTAAAPAPSKPGPSARVRFTYTKSRPLSLLSHTEMMSLFFRAVSRAGLPIRFSEGFNPHPKMSFGPALAVGIESGAELLDMELDYTIDLQSVVKALNKALPAEVRVREARVLSPTEPPAGVGITRYSYVTMPPEGLSAPVKELVGSFMEAGSVPVERVSGKSAGTLDIRPMVAEMTATDGGLVAFTLVESGGKSAKPFEVVQALFGLSARDARAVRIKRVAMS